MAAPDALFAMGWPRGVSGLVEGRLGSVALPGGSSVSVIHSGRFLVAGTAQGELLVSETALSFWGGVDSRTGTIIDQHHPLRGQSLAQRVLAVPGARGSCSGSGTLLELILNGHAPVAIVVYELEQILSLGALVADLMFQRSIPILQVERSVIQGLGRFRYARIAKQGDLHVFDDPPSDGWRPDGPQPDRSDTPTVRLAPIDQAFLSGKHGKAAQVAMHLLCRMADLQGARTFIDVSQVHIDGCIYSGPACLRFAELLLEWQARVRVPTTLNSISVDKRRWRALGVAEELGLPASALADAYLSMGARPSFTCAPYLLDSAPGFGEQIGWAESNAVVYANSVIGARTMKYPDFLDVCIALTGRAPLAGCHLDAGRCATLEIGVERPNGADDSYWPLLGYCCGALCGSEIPLIAGLEATGPGPDELKAFAAAFATTAAAPMFHMSGVTPEASGQAPSRRVRISHTELQHAWNKLNTAAERRIGLISFGNPHLSLNECRRLAALMDKRTKAPEVVVIVTCGRDVHDAASKAGYVAAIEAFGAKFITDTCWCMLGEPVVPPNARTLMTNSVKYAHYAPGLVGRGVRLGGMAGCVDAAAAGEAGGDPPDWLCSLS
jgi:predicted aconitase/predicted aconitase with swiveling domain